MTINLGDEQVDLESIECMEALSTPFTVMVDVLARLEIDLHPHLGKPCSLRVLEDGEVLRHFHGLIVSSDYQSEGNGGNRYRLTLKPWTYFMAQNRNMAIFQDKTPVEILRLVFAANGVSDFEFNLSRVRGPRVYCVQYRESDFAFISRIMEEEGIYYYFRHERERHVMVLCDAPTAHPAGNPGTLSYNPQTISVFGADSKERGSSKSYLQSWNERVSTTAEAKVVLRDFNFRSPDKPMQAKFEGELEHPRDNREVYDYPGGFSRETLEIDQEVADGKERAESLLQNARSQRRVFSGTAQSSGLCVGTKVSVSDHQDSPRMNASYLITSTYHSVAAEKYRSGASVQEDSFNVRFEAIPADTPFQPPHVTPRPVVAGLESAIVTGPEGEKIYTDEYGRVKVRFHWDRAGTKGEESTCWIRVSQTGGLGNVILPRVGHEVLVDFLGGDPDRPIVVGRVFNQSHMPIYDLPANKTKALWRTMRYGDPGEYAETEKLDCDPTGANEIRMDDKGGHEELFVYAERLMNTRVRYRETHHVGNDQDVKIGNNRTKKIKMDEEVEIGQNRSSKIGGGEKLDVKLNQQVIIQGAQETKVSKNNTIDVGTEYKLEAKSKITLICGGSSITMSPQGIEIKGMTVKIDGGMKLESKALDATYAGTMVHVQGTMVLINSG